MDEIFGGYAHIYQFDFDMLKILLNKWGFSKIKQSTYGKSIDEDMKEPLCVVSNKKKYSLKSSFVKNKEFLNYKSWYHSGFDKSPETSLFVECIKTADKKYSPEKEYDYNKRNKFDSKEDKIKLFFIKRIIKALNLIFTILRKLKKF